MNLNITDRHEHDVLKDALRRYAGYCAREIRADLDRGLPRPSIWHEDKITTMNLMDRLVSLLEG